jgi:hypothetical protein
LPPFVGGSWPEIVTPATPLRRPDLPAGALPRGWMRRWNVLTAGSASWCASIGL